VNRLRGTESRASELAALWRSFFAGNREKLAGV
jgi:hypothetical protein